MDIYSPRKRSQIMARIRSEGTLPELRLYRLTRSILESKFRIYRNCKRIVGTPDLYIPALQLVFFVDGCFFHDCPIHGHVPKSNSEYWKRKISRNVARDKRYRRRLRSMGLSVWRFWEHEFRRARLESTSRRVERAIQNRVQL